MGIAQAVVALLVAFGISCYDGRMWRKFLKFIAGAKAAQKSQEKRSDELKRKVDEATQFAVRRYGSVLKALAEYDKA